MRSIFLIYSVALVLKQCAGQADTGDAGMRTHIAHTQLEMGA